MAVTIPGAAQIALTGTNVGGETWANVWHIAIGSDTFDNNEADAVLGAVEDYVDDLLPRRHNTWQAREVRIRDIRTEGNPTFVYPLTSKVGGGNFQLLPLNVAAVVTLRSPTNSRRGRGRTYLSGMQATALASNDSQWTQAFIDDETEALAALATDLSALGWPLAIASRVAGQVFAVQTVTMDSIPDTQRRRVRDLVASRNASEPVGP